MKITIKTLKGELFPVDAESTQTILDIKNKIKELKSFQPDAQKLVYKGKNTVNTDTLESLGVKEGDFMVVMVTIKKPDPPKQPEQPKVEQPKVEQPKVQQPKPVVEPTKPVVQQPQQQTKTSSQSNLVVGAQYEATVAQLMTMGFDRPQVESALKAAFNNPERAVEYLLNGIPKSANNPPPVQQPGGGNNNPLGNLTADPALLAALINSPQFVQIRQMIRNDPSTLPAFLQQIAQTSPQLSNLIIQNPELFERLIMEDSPQLPQVQNQPPPGSIMVTNEEKAAIDRLAALGFSKMEAAQVYMACDKNQQLAANLLFDRLAQGDIEIEGGQSFPDEGGEDDKEEDDDNLFS